MSVATRTGSRRLSDASRGLGALLGVVALTVGVPVALISWVGWPLPAEMPTLDEIADALRDTYIPDAFLIKSLALICWLVWVELVASLIIEAVAYARGRQAGRLPLASTRVQRAAARLVATSALLGALLATRGVPEVVNRSLRPPESVTLVVDQQRAPGPGADQPAENAPTSLPTYEVQRRDTLWGIAETHLGDPFRWQEVFDLNRGRPQPDGRSLRDPDLICPGWVLQLPADAAVAQPAPPEPPVESPADPAPSTSTVSPTPPGDGAAAGLPTGEGMILVDEAALGIGATDTEIVSTSGSVASPAGQGRGAAGRLPADAASAAPKPVEEAPPASGPGPADPSAVPAAAGTPADPAPQPAAAGQVTVQPGDNFWELAEARLAAAWGRPPTNAEIVGYWQSLIDGNRDQLAPPGDPDLIYPGQVFTTPAPPADPTAVAAPPAAPSPPVDPAPTPSPPPGPPPDQGDAGAGSPSGSGTGSVGVPGGEDDADRGPTTTAGEGSTPTTTAGDETGSGPPAAPDRTPATDTAASSAAAPAEDDAGTALPIGLIGGGVALAGVVLLLERRRRAQQRHRGRGRMIEMPPLPLQHDERAMREGAEVDRARLLELAVRAAAAGSGATGLPPIRWVEVTSQSVVVVLGSPAPPPPGFTALAADRWITHAPLEKLSALAGRVAMPVPTLVPVGATAEDAELLVELEAGGVVSIAGPPQEALEVLRAMAVAAATAPWGEQSQVVLVGMEGELLDLPWVNTLPQLSEAIARAESHAERATSALRSLRCPSTSQARAAGVSPERWEPLLVISALQPSDLGERQRLVALAARPRSATAVVTPAGGIPLGAGMTMTIGDNGWLRIDDVDVDVWPHRLDDEDAEVLMTLLDVASQRGEVDLGEQLDQLDVRRPGPRPPLPSPVPTPPPAVGHGTAEPGASELGEDPTAVPAAAAPVDPIVASVPAVPDGAPVRHVESLLAGVEVLVRVLGEVEAVRLTPGSAEGVEQRLVPTRQKGLEAITYLALRESAVDREDLEINLFPDGANAAKTVYNTVSSARMLVGEELFPPTQGGRYELSDRVVSDYGLFCELVAQADEIEDVEAAASLLTEALGLVRGEPFTGVGRGYAWVGPHRGMIVAQVVDAAEELAEVRLAMGDWRAAEWAARRGLRAFPSDERMYRLLMRAARAAGNVPGVQRVFRELCEVIADPDVGVEPEDTVHPETVALLEELTGVVPRDGRLGA